MSSTGNTHLFPLYQNALALWLRVFVTGPIAVEMEGIPKPFVALSIFAELLVGAW